MKQHRKKHSGATRVRKSSKLALPTSLSVEDAQRIMDDAKSESKNPWCSHCLRFHLIACPRVRSIEWLRGEISRVEFFETWDKSETWTQLEVADIATQGT